MQSLGTFYDDRFYRGQSGSSFEAGMTVLPHILDVVKPSSIVDVGCGVGTWLAAARKLGVGRAVGVEGPWVNPDDLLDPEIELNRHNLEQPFTLDERFDMAMSLEVAEHLTPERAESFVDDISKLSDVVLFGAAIPGQGGVNHIHERWQSFWLSLFEARGYEALDVVRPRFWEDGSIQVHYRQNTFLYVRGERAADIKEGFGDALASASWNVDLVHPQVHLNNYAAMMTPPTLPQALKITARLPVYLWRSIQARFPGRRNGGGDAPRP